MMRHATASITALHSPSTDSIEVAVTECTRILLQPLFFAFFYTIKLNQLVLYPTRHKCKSYDLQKQRTASLPLVLSVIPRNLQKKHRFSSAKSCTLIAVRKILQPERKDDAHG